MRTHRSFLKGISIIYLSLVILFFNCTEEIETAIDAIDTIDILSDVFTFELEFGADNLPDEYLIAQGYWSPDANDSGDVFIADESRIKVYDKDGKAKMIIGGPGQGPGEFPSRVTHPIISPTGYLTVSENVGWTIFSPEYKFIKNVRIKRDQRYKNLVWEKGWEGLMFSQRKVYSFDENRHVFGAIVQNKIYPLIYEDKDTLIVIAEYEDTRKFILLNGDLFWAVPSSDKIYYTHTDYDRSKESGSYKYVLNVFNYADYSKEHFVYEYYPVVIPDSLIDREKKRHDDWDKAVRDQALDLIDKLKYHPPLQKLYADKNLIFAVTFYKNDKGEYLTDVIDAESGEKIKSVFFSMLPNAKYLTETELVFFSMLPGVIKNGCAYMLGYNEEGFRVIRKYRIDPAVYEK